MELHLDGNAIQDLAPLAGHVELAFATLIDNAVTSLAPVHNAPWLTPRSSSSSSN